MTIVVLFLALLLSVSTAGACLMPLDVVETWSTYCDNGVERVRLTIEFSLSDSADLSESGSEFYVGTSCLDPDPCPGPDGRSGVLSDLGGGNYRFVLAGWEKACFPNSEAVRDGAIFWRCFFEPGQSQTVLFVSTAVTARSPSSTRRLACRSRSRAPRGARSRRCIGRTARRLQCGERRRILTPLQAPPLRGS